MFSTLTIVKCARILTHAQGLELILPIWSCVLFLSKSSMCASREGLRMGATYRMHNTVPDLPLFAKYLGW
jgi:hypothetical protein